jgi:hypothetical protein
MQAALIIMTILGCDDTATQCHYIEKVETSWATMEACDADSEARLKAYATHNYPVIVAVCQTPDAAEAAVAETEAEAGGAPQEKEPGLTGRVLAETQARLAGILPARGTVKSLVARPVRVVAVGYSWVAQRF